MEFIWFFSLIIISKANRTEIVIDAPTEIWYKQDNISVLCKPLVNQGSINFIKLRKKTVSGSTHIAAIFQRAIANTNSKIVHKGNRAIVIGSLQVNSSKLLYNIPAEKVKCSDRGTYRCEMAYTVGNASFRSAVARSIKIKVKPSHLNPIKTSPQSQNGRFLNKTTVTLICNGTVGSPARDIRWCYRTEDEFYLPYFKIDAIIQRRALRTGCQNIRQSILTYTVNDERIDFLCETGQHTICGEGTVVKTYTIHMCNYTDCLDIKSSAYHSIPRFAFFTAILQIVFLNA